MFCIGLLVLGCDKGYDPIERDKMVEIVADLYIAEHVLRNYDIRIQDSIRQGLRESLLKVYNVSQAQLDTNLYLYQFDTKAYREFSKDVVKLLEQKRDSLDQKNIDENKEE